MRDLEGGRQLRGGVSADPDIERGGVDEPVARGRVPVAQLAGPERETHRPRLAGLECDALEALELAHRSGGRPVTLVDVELHNLVALAGSRVRDIDRHVQRVARGDRIAVDG